MKPTPTEFLKADDYRPGERIVSKLRVDLYGALMGQETGFFDAQKTGELSSRLSSDATVLQTTVTANLSMMLRNAAQAVSGTTADPRVRLVTRVARYVTLARKRHRLALALAVEDNGPGVPEAIRDRIFYPLVSGREGGSGLGLTLAQTFIAQHGGTIECESRPGRTVFSILLPLERSAPAASH